MESFYIIHLVSFMALVLDDSDNVAVALRDLKPGDVVNVFLGDMIKVVKIRDKVPKGHKFAIKNIKKGEKILKYGEIIGIASKDILEGEHVHVHNVISYYKVSTG